jgi:hypothetical protein
VSQSQRPHFLELSAKVWKRSLVVVVVALATLLATSGGRGRSSGSSTCGSTLGSSTTRSRVTTCSGAALGRGTLLVASGVSISRVGVGIATCCSRRLSTGSATLGLSALCVTSLTV